MNDERLQPMEVLPVLATGGTPSGVSSQYLISRSVAGNKLTLQCREPLHRGYSTKGSVGRIRTPYRKRLLPSLDRTNHGTAAKSEHASHYIVVAARIR